MLSMSMDFKRVLAQHEQQTLPVVESQSMAVCDPLGFGH